jgi:predicted HTH domain antitoxin
VVQIIVEVPDEIAENLQANDLPRTLLESFALEGYRSGALTEEQIRRLLGFEARMEVHGFLKEHAVFLNYNREELEQDMETLRRFREEGPSRS